MDDIATSLARSRAAAPKVEGASQVRGRHYIEWVPALDEMRSAGEKREDEYLELLLEVLDAIERASVHSVSAMVPPGYFRRVATVYRRRKDYGAEVAVLERWERLTAGTSTKLTDRLTKARELAAKG